MIHTAKQLKDKVRNMSNGDNDIAKTMIRNFIMERFLERVALSDYQNNFILKGGMLVASIVGVDIRATMDIDTTVKGLLLNEKAAKKIIEEICNTHIEDGVRFQITSTKKIMENFDYPGVRMMVEATLERMRQTIKIDISTDDVITPQEIKYEYKLMFEDRTISLLSYNIETLLAEKMQTILARGLANTRLRDFYDVYEVMLCKGNEVNIVILKEAFSATCNKRNTVLTLAETEEILSMIIKDLELAKMWEHYKKANYFVGNLDWKTIVTYNAELVKRLMKMDK